MNAGLMKPRRNYKSVTCKRGHARSLPGARCLVCARTHSIWRGMVRRCHLACAREYHRYGWRGIRVCERWRASFDAFLEDMGPAPNGRELDRIDNDGNYEPSNCRWATRREQVRNTRRSTRLTGFGKTMNLVDWAEEYGMNKVTLLGRLRKGLSLEDAVKAPVRKSYARVVPSEVRARILSLRAAGLTYVEISKRVGCSKSLACKVAMAGAA